MWRILYEKLPFNDILVKFGHMYVSKYFCCRSSQGETLNHIFMGGNIAAMTWKIFGSSLGVRWDDIPT